MVSCEDLDQQIEKTGEVLGAELKAAAMGGAVCLLSALVATRANNPVLKAFSGVGEIAGGVALGLFTVALARDVNMFINLVARQMSQNRLEDQGPLAEVNVVRLDSHNDHLTTDPGSRIDHWRHGGVDIR